MRLLFHHLLGAVIMAWVSAPLSPHTCWCGTSPGLAEPHFHPSVRPSQLSALKTAPCFGKEGAGGNRGWLACGRGYSPRGGQQLGSTGFPEQHSCLLPTAAAAVSLGFSPHLHLPKPLQRDIFWSRDRRVLSLTGRRRQAAAAAATSLAPSRGRKAGGNRRAGGCSPRSPAAGMRGC